MRTGIDRQGLLDTLGAWDGFLKKKVRLIACGGTAMTLLGVKASTKDIDLIAPDLDEYKYLIATLKDLGYTSVSGVGWSRDEGFVFDIFGGNRVHTTELLTSPLEKGKHYLVKEYNRIYLGVLNYYDIIISKLFRSTSIDIEDSLALLKSKKKEIDLKQLDKLFRETASYNVTEEKMIGNWEHFLNLTRKERLSK